MWGYSLSSSPDDLYWNRNAVGGGCLCHKIYSCQIRARLVNLSFTNYEYLIWKFPTQIRHLIKPSLRDVFSPFRTRWPVSIWVISILYYWCERTRFEKISFEQFFNYIRICTKAFDDNYRCVRSFITNSYFLQMQIGGFSLYPYKRVVCKRLRIL